MHSDAHHAHPVRVLGPFQVLHGDIPLLLGGQRPRALLAALVARAGTAVSRDELILEIWGDTPPRTAVDTLHSYVSRLRRVLGASTPATIRTMGTSYVLDLAVGGVDGRTFEAMVERGQAALRTGRCAEAAVTLRGALALWTGAAYDDVVRGPIAGAEAHRLEELRLSALEDRIESELASGQAAALVPELDVLSHQHPLRERLQAQRMLALYRTGRQADALETFQRARAVLVDELGIEPGPLLRDLQARILSQDPDLEWTGAVVDAAPAEPDPRLPLAGNVVDPLVTPLGIEHEVAALAQLVRQHRLVTATALTGTGTTTLALATARALRGELPDGVWTVTLPVGADAVVAAGAVAEALELPDHGADPGAVVAAALRARTALLVLEGCDDAPGAAALVDRLLGTCRHLRVLATGQRRLQLHYEQRFRVRPLRLPAADAGQDTQLESAATRLLLDRIRRWSPGFTADRVTLRHVMRVVRALDGLPLALEIAAECAESLGLERVADLAETSPGALRGRPGGPGGTVRSVAAMLDRSMTHLEPGAARLLPSLAVFDGGFTPDALLAVCTRGEGGRDAAPEQLAALADSSVIEPQATTTGVARFTMSRLLRHAVRQADDELVDHLSFRHAGYYASLAETAGPKVIGAEQVHWLNRLHEEQANLRQALRWSVDTGEIAVAMRVISGAWRFWRHFGHAHEGYHWVEEVLGGQDRDADLHAGSALRQRFSYGGGRLALAAGDTTTARHLMRTSHALAREREDDRATAVTLAGLADVAVRDRDHRTALRVLRQASNAAGRAGDAWSTATVRQAEGAALREARAHDQARRAFEAAEDGFHDAGDEWSACLARLDAAQVATMRGDIATAAALHRTNLECTIDLTASTFDFVGLPRDIRGLAMLAARAGHRDLAVALQASARMVEEAGDVRSAMRGDPRDLLRHALEETRILSPS